LPASKNALPFLVERTTITSPELADSAELWPDGKSVLLSGAFEGVWRQDLTTGAVMTTYRDIRDNVCWMSRVSSDGSRVVAGFGDMTFHVWDAATGHETFMTETHDAIVTRVSLSTDGKRALTVAGNKVLAAWDIDVGRELLVVHHKKSFALACALASGGDVALHGGTDGVVRAVEVPSGKELWKTPGNGWLESMDASADGRLCASTGRGKVILLWDVESGSVRRTIPLTGNSSFVTLSPDGRFVLALGKAAPTVFATDTGKPVAAVLTPQRIRAARFAHDSKSLVVSDASKAIRVFDLP
jgi:WD40 repeat protein